MASPASPSPSHLSHSHAPQGPGPSLVPDGKDDLAKSEVLKAIRLEAAARLVHRGSPMSLSGAVAGTSGPAWTPLLPVEEGAVDTGGFEVLTLHVGALKSFWGWRASGKNP